MLLCLLKLRGFIDSFKNFVFILVNVVLLIFRLAPNLGRFLSKVDDNLRGILLLHLTSLLNLFSTYLCHK